MDRNSGVRDAGEEAPDQVGVFRRGELDGGWSVTDLRDRSWQACFPAADGAPSRFVPESGS